MKPSKDPGVKPPEWWKHARPYNKRKFHKKVRRLIRAALRKGEPR